MADWTWTDEEVAAEMAAAREATRQAEELEPRAISARFDRDARRVIVDLSNGALFIFPVDRVQGLQGAADDDLSIIEVTPSGEGLHWPQLDWDCGVPNLMNGRFGSDAWMARQRQLGNEPPPRTARG